MIGETIDGTPNTNDRCPQCGGWTMPKWASVRFPDESRATARRCASCSYIEERSLNDVVISEAQMKYSVSHVRDSALQKIKTDYGLAQYILNRPHKTSAYMQDWAMRVINEHEKGKKK